MPGSSRAGFPSSRFRTAPSSVVHRPSLQRSSRVAASCPAVRRRTGITASPASSTVLISGGDHENRHANRTTGGAGSLAPSPGRSPLKIRAADNVGSHRDGGFLNLLTNRARSLGASPLVNRAENRVQIALQGRLPNHLPNRSRNGSQGDTQNDHLRDHSGV
jgi:hypothetical protein